MSLDLATLKALHCVDDYGYRAPVLVRFLRRVVQEGDCWVWTGRTLETGYTTFTVASRVHRAHRLAYELLVGPIPDGLQLDHLCRRRNCVRPDHLEPVDCRTNLHRGNTFQAENTAKTHCPDGHAYDAVNTRIDRRGSRVCRACRRKGGRNAAKK